MKNYIENCQLLLTVRGPVFIGSGQSIMKKEYILLPDSGRLIIPDIGKMYADLTKLNKNGIFDRFLLAKTNDGLGDWLRDEGINNAQILKWKRYELDMGDTLQEKGRPLQIMSFMKDIYGNPYIPGSSLKGMLRTILLYWEIKKICRSKTCIY